MDIKERSALCTFANHDEAVSDLFVAIEKLSETNQTAITTLLNAMLEIANQRAETFFTKLKPLGYKKFDDAINAYCDYEDCNNKED